MSRFTTLLTTSVLTLSAGSVAAAGYAIKEQSALGQGRSFAGMSSAGDDLSGIFFNPATLAHIDGNQVQVMGSLIVPNSKASNTVGLGGLATGDTSDNGGQGAFVPGSYGSYHYSDALRLGVGVTAPFGLTTAYDDDWTGRYDALTSALKTINFTPTVAYNVNDRFAIGGGIQIQYIDARLTNALFTPLGDGHADISGDDVGIGFTAGLTYDLTDRTRVGLSYRSKIDHTLKGDAEFTVNPAFAGLFPATDAEVSVETPDSVNLGITHHLDHKWTLHGEVSWTNWSVFDELRIEFADAVAGSNESVTPEEWDDSWFVAIGADYKGCDKWTLRGGVAYDQSPIDDEFRTPRIPGSDRYWVSVGATYEVNDRLSIDAGYSHIFMDDADVNLPSEGFSAEYESQIDILSVQLRYAF